MATQELGLSEQRTVMLCRALSVSSTPYKVDRTLTTLKGWRVTSAWTRRR